MERTEIKRARTQQGDASGVVDVKVEIEAWGKVSQTAWQLGKGLYLLPLNINSSHLSVVMLIMNNTGSTHLCQRAELFIQNHRLALVHTVGCRHICLLRLYNMCVFTCSKCWCVLHMHINTVTESETAVLSWASGRFTQKHSRRTLAGFNVHVFNNL